jgi:hypothetical protein
VFDTISQAEFEQLRADYARVNNAFTRSVLFKVGSGAGFFSEVGGMIASMVYCYHHKIRFTIFADTFAGPEGWESFFQPFCPINHNRLNNRVNGRDAAGGRLKTRLLVETLKRSAGAELLTADVFWEATGDFKTSVDVDWPEFDIHGTTWPEYQKLFPLALRFNGETRAAVDAIKARLPLPRPIYSVHIRSGDKITEQSELLTVPFCIEQIESSKPDVKNLFVLTDDYTNIEELQRLRPAWNILTLTSPEERGYWNDQFFAMPWEQRRENLILFFAIVEICVESDFHFGCEHSNISHVIRAIRRPDEYAPLGVVCS